MLEIKLPFSHVKDIKYLTFVYFENKLISFFRNEPDIVNYLLSVENLPSHLVHFDIKMYVKLVDIIVIEFLNDNDNLFVIKNKRVFRKNYPYHRFELINKETYENEIEDLIRIKNDMEMFLRMSDKHKGMFYHNIHKIVEHQRFINTHIPTKFFVPAFAKRTPLLTYPQGYIKSQHD
jgi:hypothetical protein